MKRRKRVLDKLARRKAAEDAFVRFVKLRWEQKRPVGDSKTASNYAPKVFAQLPENEEGRFSQREFEHAMNCLFSAHKIDKVTKGPPSKSREYIIIVEGGKGIGEEEE